MKSKEDALRSFHFIHLKSNMLPAGYKKHFVGDGCCSDILPLLHTNRNTDVQTKATSCKMFSHVMNESSCPEECTKFYLNVFTVTHEGSFNPNI